MTREYLPPIAGSIQTAIGVVRFQFVSSGSAVPAVVLTNHGLTADFKYDDREVRFRFLVAPASDTGRWQRTDVAEPDCDFMDGSDPVPAAVRTQVHDSCLDAWETYMEQRPELVDYARLTEVNNDIVQLDEKIDRLGSQLQDLKGRRSNLIQMESRIRAKVNPAPPPDLSDSERYILSQMLYNNCWLTTEDGQDAQLHPYQSADILESVDSTAANRLVTCGFIQLHRNLEGSRVAWRMAERGRKALEG